MESLVTLVVLIVVFNIISAIFRAVRGGQAPSRRAEPVRPDLPEVEGKLDPWGFIESTDKNFSLDDDKDRNDYSRFEEEERGNDDKAEKRQIITLPIKQKTCRPVTLATGLQQVLTRKDPLVSAFIFHELFGPPTALRRKR